MSEIPELPSVAVQGGPLDGHEVKLSPGTTMIVGSGRLAHLRLDHPDIELAHIKVMWDDLGISMIDNGSRKGTWVNGEPVETAALLDGDVIAFVAPDAKSAPPRLRIRIPKGSVPEPPPPPEPPVGEQAAPAPARPAPAARRRVSARRRPTRRLPLPDLRLLGLAAAGVLVLGGGGWLAKRLFFTAPQIDSIQPSESEPGRTVTISGTRFSGEAEKNIVWFGDRSVPAESVSGGALQVKVPALARAGTVPVSVETARGRSRPAPLVVLTPLKAASLDPPGALPGDEVVLNGQGFADGPVTVTVGGTPARVVAAEAAAVRFAMPSLSAAPGTPHAVVATVGGRSTAPLSLYLGRVPLVAAFDPPRAVAGELVRIRGAGFATTPEGNAVTFDGEPALVVASTGNEMAVIAPSLPRPQPETLAPVVVQAGGRTSSTGPAYPLLRLVEGAWVLRFLAAAVGEGGAKGQAVVGTEIAPVLLLSWKDEARSTAERALRVANGLNAAVDRARVGQKVAFEVREQPAIGVAVAGSPDLLVRVTPQDAAAYETPPGLSPRAAPPTPVELARHWAALLGDYLVVGTSGGRPAAAAGASPAAGAAFTQLRAALPWQYGSGVSSARVAALPNDLKRRLREVALRVP